MTGTLLNSAAIIVGAVIGIVLGTRLPEKLKQTVILTLGLFTLLYAIQLFLKTENAIVPLLSLLFGVIVGEWWDIDDRLVGLSSQLENRLLPTSSTRGQNGGKFIRGFLSTALIYCSGPMAILGPIQNGLTGDISTLSVKSILDGFGSLAFASSLGIGVAFSSIPVLLYQGTISLFAVQVQALLNTSMINELTAVGGLILASIAIDSFLEIKRIRTANMLPALIFAPIIARLFQLF
ncbi:MAG: DUF554 domain-containing protein [Leptolinea sp.]|jgi:uncharacterized membrane protein YqgA involved in biofilm formation|nr:DUF554 domain-containing protein [Leptolinea sp.]